MDDGGEAFILGGATYEMSCAFRWADFQANETSKDRGTYMYDTHTQMQALSMSESIQLVYRMQPSNPLFSGVLEPLPRR